MTKINDDCTVDKAHQVDPSAVERTEFNGCYVETSVNKLTELLGPPITGGWCAVEWLVDSPNGAFAIYDWKETLSPVDNPDMTFMFHIGERERGTGALALARAIQESPEELAIWI